MFAGVLAMQPLRGSKATTTNTGTARIRKFALRRHASRINQPATGALTAACQLRNDTVTDNQQGLPRSLTAGPPCRSGLTGARLLRFLSWSSMILIPARLR